jgi:hypothetical protein
MGEFGSTIDRQQLLTLRYCMELNFNVPRNEMLPLSAEGSIFDALSALRLVKPGQVGVPFITKRCIRPTFGKAGGTQISSSPDSGSFFAGYQLDADAASSATTLYRRLRAAPPAGSILLALRRFNQAFARRDPADKLIDFWIALEALFLPDGNAELTFKAALRVAYYCGATVAERTNIFDALTKSYTARSLIVHGKPVPGLAQALDFTELVLRQSLRQAITDQSSVSRTALKTLVLEGQVPTLTA